jgi:hypothetical protein
MQINKDRQSPSLRYRLSHLRIFARRDQLNTERGTDACVDTPLPRDDDRNEDFVEDGLRDSSLADAKSDEDRDNDQLREGIANLKGQLRKAERPACLAKEYPVVFQTGKKTAFS